MGTVTVVETVLVTTEIAAAAGPVGLIFGGAVIIGLGVGALVHTLANSGGSKNNKNSKKKQENQNETTKKAKSSNSSKNSERSNASAGSGGSDDPNHPRGSSGSRHQNDENSDSDNINEESSSDEIDFTSTESREILVSGEFASEDRREIRYADPHGRSHRYYRIRRYFIGTGSRFETDHAPSLATLKKLLMEVRPYIINNNVPRHLRRVIRMLKKMFKTNYLLSIDINNLRIHHGQKLFAILNIRQVHRKLDSTGNSRRQLEYTDVVTNLFMTGNFQAAFEHILQDYHNTIMANLSCLNIQSAETLYDWMLSYVDFLQRKDVITKSEKEYLDAFVKNSEDKVIELLKK